MATLNTLRTRGGIIVSVVIGIALVAFLLGDLTSSGGMSNAQKTTVGIVDGSKIGYMEYATKLDELTKVSQLMSGQNTLSEQDQITVSNMAWEAMAMTHAYKPGFDKMGILAGAGEQTDMTTGVYISPILSSIFVDRMTGAYSSDMLRSFIANLDADASGQSAMIWNHLKSQMIEQRVVNKYLTLVTKGQFVTDLEANNAVEQANTSVDAKFVRVNFTTVPDSLVVVTDAEIKKYYTDNKDKYKQDPVREIEYVIFELAPSNEDYQAAEKFVNELSQEFKSAENPMQFAQLNSYVQPSTSYAKKSELSNEIAAAVFTKDEVYGPVLEDNRYTMIRRADKRSLPDSLGAKHILIDKTNTNLRDSLLKVIKAGSSFESLAVSYSIDTNSAMNGGSLGIFTPEQMIPEFSEACVKAKVGEVFTVDTQFGTHIVKLTEKSKLEPKVQLATIVYDVDPSSRTEQVASTAASKFVAAANGSIENFKNALTECNVKSLSAGVTPEDRSVNALPDSRELLRWAYNSKEGDVSSIMSINGNYVVAVLKSVKESKYTPLEAVKAPIVYKLKQEKKSDYILSKITGTTLDAVAVEFKTDVKTVSDLKYTSFSAGSAGYELKLIGAITTTEDLNVVSKPLVGNRSVFMYEVTDVKNVEDTDFETEKSNLATKNLPYIANNVTSALNKLCEVEDFRVKFF